MTRPPKNPFRTERIEEDDILENVFVRFLYGAVVLSLLVAILMSLITLIGATMARALAERCGSMDHLGDPFLSPWCSERRALDGSMYVYDWSARGVRERRPADNNEPNPVPPLWLDVIDGVPTTRTTSRLRLSLFAKMTQSHGNHVVLALTNIWRLDGGGKYGHHHDELTKTPRGDLKQKIRRRRRTALR
jgi:hypothetical protein